MRKRFVAAMAVLSVAFVMAGCDKKDNAEVTTANNVNILDTTASNELIEETTAGLEVVYGQITVEGNSVVGTAVTGSAQCGNTAGNLVNSGIVCESGNKIYYYNKSDNKKLYVMNKDGSGKTPIGNVQGAMELNLMGDFMYYQAGGIYRVNVKDGSVETLVASDCHNMVVTDSAVFYTKTDNGVNKIFRMNHDGSDEMALSENIASGLNVYEDKIYYINGTDSGKIYSMNLDGSDDNVFFVAKNVQELLVDNGWVYYVSNSNLGNHIFCISVEGGEESVEIISDSCSNINMYAGYLYYYNASDDTLCYSAGDGSNETVLYSGNLNAVNVIADWVYFFNTDDFQYYRITKDGNNIEVVE